MDETALWATVPEPEQEVNYIVDPIKDNEFTVVADTEVAGYDVAELIYMVGGVWRVTVDDQDDEDQPSAVYSVLVDRRFKAESVRDAVSKLLENLYNMAE
jgi:hypothetical protein